MALSQYIPLYIYMPNNVESSRERMGSLMQKASSLQPWKQSREQSLAKYLKKELDVEIPLEVATQLLLYNNLKNLLEGILTIQDSILQKKIVKSPEPFDGKKAIEILYPGPEGTVTHLADDLITLKEARSIIQKKSSQLFWQVDKNLLEPAIKIAQATLLPNLLYSQKENDRRIEEIIRIYPLKIVQYMPGDVLVPFGKVMGDEDIYLLTEYIDVKKKGLFTDAPWVITSIILIVVLYNFLLSNVLSVSLKKEPPYILHLFLLIIAILVFRSLLVFTSFPIYALPISFLPILIVLLNHNKLLAIMTTATIVVLASIIACRSVEFFLFAAFGGFAAILTSSKIHKRAYILIPSLVVGIINAVFALTFSTNWDVIRFWPDNLQMTELFFSGEIFDPISLSHMSWAFFGGLISGPLALLLLPLLELSWHTSSTFKLNKFVNLELPLMRDLLVKAPGTYQHTMTVAYLAQAAGEAIGADTLLLRTGAYYHDIGKIKKPEFFVENQFDKKNHHDDLTPAQSTKLIINHVENGKKIAQGAGLPNLVINLIQQHHGTQLVEYFYNKASKSGSADRIKERNYRYPGPKPQSVEAAILLIVDAVEAASRSIPGPTKKKIEKMIRFIIEKRITDGQFDECDLSTHDLAKINRALLDSLEATFHSRVAYPWQEKGKTKKKSSQGTFRV